MKESQLDNSKLQALFDEFYTALPHRPQYRTTSFSMSWLARKLDLCQVWVYVTQVCHYVRHCTMSLYQAYDYLRYDSNTTMSVILLWQLYRYDSYTTTCMSGMPQRHYARYSVCQIWHYARYTTMSCIIIHFYTTMSYMRYAIMSIHQVHRNVNTFIHRE